MLPPIPLVKKVCLIGPPGIGKTAHLERYAANRWQQQHVPTLAPKVTRTEMVLPLADRVQEVAVQVMVWDFPQPDHPSRREGTKLQGAAGLMLLARADSPDPVSEVLALRDWTDDFAPEAVHLGVLCQADRASHARGAFGRLAERAQEGGLPLMNASARTGEGVRASFLRMGEMLVAREPL